MGIKEHVEELLVRQGAARVRAASEPSGPYDGYVTECPGGRGAIVRCSPVTMVDSPGVEGRRVVVSSGLEECADVLIGAGLHVERVQDERGADLRVATSP